MSIIVIRAMYKNNVSQKEKKKKKYIKSSLHPLMCTLPLTKISYTNPHPNYDNSHNQNYSPFLSRVTKGKSVK